MKYVFSNVLGFMLPLAKIPNSSTLMGKKNSKSEAGALLKVIQAFHIVCIALYIGCSGPMVESLAATD